MTRDEALELVKQNVANNINLVRHMLAAEAIMRRLAQRFGEDADLWGLAGLLHDLDYDSTADKPEIHALRSADMLAGTDVPEAAVHAILAHADKAPRESPLDKALWVTDPLTGFLVAAALMTPEKRLTSVDLARAMKRFEEKAFAKGASREQMTACTDMDLSLEEFMGLGIEAMQGISDELGL